MNGRCYGTDEEGGEKAAKGGLILYAVTCVDGVITKGHIRCCCYGDESYSDRDRRRLILRTAAAISFWSATSLFVLRKLDTEPVSEQLSFHRQMLMC